MARQGESDRDGERVFTEYVRALGPTGEPPDEATFSALWEHLKAALSHELRRRSSWSNPPRFVGLTGWETWDQDALDEMTAEAYQFNFIERLRSLKAQVEMKANIEGLVYRNLRNFLHERQRRHDPLGYRTFELVHRAVALAVERGTLDVRSGDPRLRNETVLALPGSPREATLAMEPIRRALAELAPAWVHDLLPDLVTARGRRQEDVASRLAHRLPELGARGIEAFRFQELIDAVKREVRRHWGAVHLHEQGELAMEAEEGEDEEMGRMVRLYQPEPEIEEVQAYRRLTDCISRGVEHEPLDGRARHYLEQLWQALRILSASAEPIPSRRKLAELLSIPRDRFTELYPILARLLELCRDAVLGRAPFPDFDRPAS